jgi:hypothetical protein
VTRSHATMKIGLYVFKKKKKKKKKRVVTWIEGIEVGMGGNWCGWVCGRGHLCSWGVWKKMSKKKEQKTRGFKKGGMSGKKKNDVCRLLQL